VRALALDDQGKAAGLVESREVVEVAVLAVVVVDVAVADVLGGSREDRHAGQHAFDQRLAAAFEDGCIKVGAHGISG
jgi:hypothetical protein